MIVAEEEMVARVGVVRVAMRAKKIAEEAVVVRIGEVRVRTFVSQGRPHVHHRCRHCAPWPIGLVTRW